jgi:hypothetical protein
MDDHDDARSMKVLGRRRPSRGGLVAAAPFLDLVIRLRSGRPFIPKGFHRFRSVEESAAWSMQMMTARSNPGHLALHAGVLMKLGAYGVVRSSQGQRSR